MAHDSSDTLYSPCQNKKPHEAARQGTSWGKGSPEYGRERSCFCRAQALSSTPIDDGATIRVAKLLKG